LTRIKGVMRAIADRRMGRQSPLSSFGRRGLFEATERVG
jgi:hypothetical protein